MSSNLGELILTVGIDNAKLRAGLKTSETIVKGFAKGAVASLTAVGAALAAGYTGFKAITGIVEAFSRAEVATHQLKGALIGMGESVDSNLKSLDAFNSKLVENTTVSRTAAMEAEKYALTLGAPAKSLENIVTAAIGLKNIYPQMADIETATKYATLAAQGYYERLQRIIPQLRYVHTAEQAREIVSKQVQKGLILETELMDTLTGRYEQFKNHLQEAAVAIGSMFAPAMRLGVALLDGFTRNMTDIIKAVRDATYNIPNLTRVFANWTAGLHNAGDTWAWLKDVVVIVVKAIVESVDAVIGWGLAVGDAVKSVAADFKELKNNLMETTAQMKLLMSLNPIDNLRGLGVLKMPGPNAAPAGPPNPPAPQGHGFKEMWDKLLAELETHAKILDAKFKLGAIPGGPAGHNEMYGFGKVFHSLGPAGPLNAKDYDAGVNKIVDALHGTDKNKAAAPVTEPVLTRAQQRQADRDAAKADRMAGYEAKRQRRQTEKFLKAHADEFDLGWLFEGGSGGKRKDTARWVRGPDGKPLRIPAFPPGGPMGSGSPDMSFNDADIANIKDGHPIWKVPEVPKFHLTPAQAKAAKALEERMARQAKDHPGKGRHLLALHVYGLQPRPEDIEARERLKMDQRLMRDSWRAVREGKATAGPGFQSQMEKQDRWAREAKEQRQKQIDALNELKKKKTGLANSPN